MVWCGVNIMSKRCRFFVYLIVFTLCLLLAAAVIKLIFFSGTFFAQMKLKGTAVMEVEVKEEWKDPGVLARYHLQDHSEEIETAGKVDTDKLGEYTITYYWKQQDRKLQRKVRVVDTKAPKLSLRKGAVRIFENGSYQEPGYQAYDAYDGDVSGKVRVTNTIDTKKKGSYQVVYTVEDSSGNKATAQRQVEVCADPTAVKLHYAYDSYDNTMEEWWFEKSRGHKRNQGAMEEAFLKQYGAYYQGEDEKVLYLTFDEGGNDITYIKEIADILYRHQAKATFFLTRNYIRDEAEFIRTLVEQGHVIGNHSWHHYDMTTLANAQECDRFVRELTETEKTYMEVTGEPMKKVFRFPKGGGSERALKMVNDLGYRTYYWSHAYYDYASDVSKEDALKTLTEHYHNGAIYLLHPSNKGNYEALDEFLTEMERLGYRFETVDQIGA